MLPELKRQLRAALLSTLFFTVLCGALYPLVITATAQVAFRRQANGSLVGVGGRVVGSELIGQSFTDPGHFWGRPSATAPHPCNAAASAGSNLGPSNPALRDLVSARMDQLRAADPGNAALVPVDLVTASASGLDPHISPAAAEYQVRRVARARKLDEATLRAIMAQCTEDRQFGLLGEPRVNVLKLNLALDAGTR